MDDPMERTKVYKRMELRVAYMEVLHEKGKEDELAAVALSVADLRSWLTEVDAVSDGDHRVVRTRVAPGGRTESSFSLVLRHMKAMPPAQRSNERGDAVELCLEILNEVAASGGAVESAAQVAVMLHDFDLQPLMAALLERYGADLDAQKTQLWRLLIVVRNLLIHAPESTNYDELLYHETSIDEYQDSIRLADVINAGLASTIAGCRIEAVRLLQRISVRLHHDTAVRVIEILLDTVAEEANEEAAQFVIAVVWEVIFLRPRVGRDILELRDEATANLLLDKLQSPTILVRRASIHGTIRLVAHAESTTRVEVNLLCRIVQIYASGTEHDDTCQRLMFNFLEEGLQKVQRGLVKMAVLQMNRDAYLAGVPLPMSRNPASSQSQQRAICTKEESVLYRQNKLLTTALGEDDQRQVIADVCRMLEDEFSTTYSQDRVSEMLGWGSNRQ